LIVDPFRAIGLSLEVGLLAAALGLPFAVGIGWLLARRRFFGKALLTTLVFLPLVLPPVVTGFVLLRLFGRQGLGWPIPFTLAGAVLAALVVGLPLYVMAARAAFEAVDPRYEEVSLSLGVPPRRTFGRITLPLAMPGLAAGALLAFGRALGEFGATVVLAGNLEGRTRTIALAVYALLDAPQGEPLALELVAASVVLSLLTVLGWELLVRSQRRRLEVDR